MFVVHKSPHIVFCSAAFCTEYTLKEIVSYITFLRAVQQQCLFMIAFNWLKLTRAISLCLLCWCTTMLEFLWTKKIYTKLWTIYTLLCKLRFLKKKKSLFVGYSPLYFNAFIYRGTCIFLMNISTLGLNLIFDQLVTKGNNSIIQ